MMLGEILLVSVSIYSGWASVVPSCENRCLADFDVSARCQCNQPCVTFEDCCSDYFEKCFTSLNPVQRAGPFDVTDEQLRQISERLWAADTNRASSSDYTINTDGDRLFTYVNPAVLARETYSLMRQIQANYEPEIGIEETPDVALENRFIDAVMRTNVMQEAWRFLADNGLASNTESGFKAELRQYWFMQYSRSRGLALDSSGFEHVFAGETRGNSVTGFHNWVQFYQEEQANRAIYGEYLNECPPRTLKLSMTWRDNNKPVTSFIIGVSPEFELALFTVCFQARSGSPCYVSLDGNEANIVTYTMANVSPRTVGTTYDRC